MDELLKRIAADSAAHRLVEDGEPLLIGVSGGVDSMVLLHVLNELAPKHGWKMIVAHFNHLLRGRDAARDQQFVERVAKKLGAAI